jgi:hypothetical protein
MRRTGRTLIWGLAVVAVLLLPGVALADTTVDFDGFAAGTTITSQYADLGGAGQGVTFGVLPGIGPAGLDPVVRTPPTGQAQSGVNVADITTCFACEFYTPQTAGTFGVPHKQVSVDVGYLGSAAACSDPSTDPGCAVVTLLVYDAAGNQIASSSPATVTQGAGVHTPLSVSVPSASIIGFKITTRDNVDTDKNIAIDDLSFDTQTTPPPPDFTLTPAASTLNIVQGASANDALTIGRIGGSSGNVSLAVSGALPPGVHAAFAPDLAGGTSSTLTLTADPDAPVTTGTNATVKVTGTPSGSAVGPAARSFNLSLAVQQAFDVSVPPSSANIDLSACAVSIPVFLSRNLAFSGHVSLSVTGLPPGVQASFSSAQPTFPSGQGSTSVMLNLTAPANGQTLFRRTATIHASSPPLPERTATFTAGGTCPLQYDAQVTSIQITQGVQSTFLPVRDPAHPPSVTAYSEIPNAAMLRGGGPTVVRVYADLAFGPVGGVPNVPAVLAGYTHNGVGSIVPLPGSPLLPTSGTRTLQLGPSFASTAEETSETAVYAFTLPPSWTYGKIGVVGQLLPAQAPPPPVARAAVPGQQTSYAPCQTGACTANDTMTLSQIPFYNAPTVTIDPIQMTVDGTTPPPDPSLVFKWAKLVTPLDVAVEPYGGTIDITDIANTLTSCRKNPDGHSCGDDSNNDGGSRVDDWACSHGAPDFGWDIGVNTGVARGLTNYADICWDQFNGYRTAVVEYQRPLTSVAHEFFHLLGRPHASFGCGGGDNGQSAESWPPDEMGFTQSIGLDTMLGSGIAGGPYAIPSPPGGKTWFDFMSYCANPGFVAPLGKDGDAWGSVHNWNAVLEADRYHARDLASARSMLGARATAPVPSFHVSAFLNHDGTTTIVSVTPLDAHGRPASASGYHLIGLDAAGHQVTDVQMALNAVHVDHEAAPVELDGVIPSAGVVSVAIVHDGATLASRRRSAHAPTVSVRGVPVARGGRTTIRWRSHDADGDPLGAAIDYSANDGRSYRRIWIGPNRGLVRVPSRYLSLSSRARVRVTVNDGFRSTTTSSRRFRAPGAPPIVSILSPSPGVREPNDAPLVLSGQAVDDSGKLLGGKRLRWFLGARVLGTGAHIAVAGLRAGHDRIVLVGTDGAGRAGRASVTVVLRAARPLFLVLSAPKRVKRNAGVLKLKVSSSLDARLAVRTSVHARAQRFTVSRRPRTLAVHIPRSSKRLALGLSLSAGGLTRTVTVVVRRH